METQEYPNLRAQLDTLHKSLKNNIRDEGRLRAFIPYADLRKILNQDTIHGLFRCYNGENETRSNATTKHSVSQYLRILATLIYVHDESNLRRVIHYLKGFNRIRDPWVAPNDDQLPLSFEAAESLFGQQEGYSFFSGQFVFCALVIREDGDHQISSYDRLVFPFVGEEFKDEGAVGAVFKVRLARGHWLDRNGVSNDDYEKELARKIFDVGGKNNAERNKAKFYGELEKLKEIRRSPRYHKNINLHLASFDVGSQCSLFYELAEKDLEKLLLEKDCPDEWDWWAKAAFMENATDVLDALAWLHSFRPDCAVYHFDISPKNILIFRGQRESAYIKEQNHIRQTIWKLSDFDLSEFKYNKDDKSPSSTSSEGWNRSNTSSISCSLEASSYRSPEVFNGHKIGPESDVWSFACIFSLVLSYLHGGGEEVYGFQKARLRETPNGEKKWDYFFEPASTSGQSVYMHPSVEKWFKTIEEEQKSPHHREYVKQITKHLTSDVFNQHEKSKRLKSSALHGILWRAFMRFCDSHERTDSLTEQVCPAVLLDDSERTTEITHDNQRRRETESNAGNSTNSMFGSRPSASNSNVSRMASNSTAASSSTSSLAFAGHSPTIPTDSSNDTLDRTPIAEEESNRNQPHQSLECFPERPACTDFFNFCNDPNLTTLDNLLNSGARYHVTKKCRSCNYTPLERAAECSEPGILRVMLQDVCAPPINLNLDFECEPGTSFFMKCCRERWWESAIELKNNGATIDKKKLKKMGIPLKYRKALLP